MIVAGDVRDDCPVDWTHRPALGAAVCLCGWPLLAEGAVVSHRVFGDAIVAAWAAQDHHNVPVQFPNGEAAIVARADLSEAV